MEESSKFSKLRGIYETKYKALLLVPIIVLLISLALIGVKVATTGDFINKDVSLKGGVALTILDENVPELALIEQQLSSEFPDHDIAVKSISQLGRTVGFIVESDMVEDQTDGLITSVGAVLGRELDPGDYTVEVIGSSLGESFFRELILALFIAFAFMAVVVFLYFRTLIPSLAVVLAAFSDIVVTLAVVNLMGMKISTAGIAAFLMLVGYSVDTNILLSSRLLKRREGTESERILGAMGTGLTMTATTLLAVTAALFIAQSEVIRQIMTILLIGLLVDVMNTWIQNVSILRIYLKKKNRT